jgi:hypothetical protein
MWFDRIFLNRDLLAIEEISCKKNWLSNLVSQITILDQIFKIKVKGVQSPWVNCDNITDYLK